ncbi:MAG: ATP-binding protein [Nitrospinota bacterium]
MEEVLYRYNPWWEGAKVDGFIERPAAFSQIKQHLSSQQIIFLTGIRRVGKTTLLKLLIRSLIDEGIPSSHILYISLDDYLLSKHTILKIIEEYRKIHKIRFNEKIYLFLDEVTYQADFEVQLKNIYDAHHAKVYASSSVASILKGRKSYLTGRNVLIEVLPLDFREYLGFKGIALSKADSHLIDSYFEDYMCTGGLPEYVIRGDIGYLKELVDDIIYKDIAAVHGIKNPQLLKDFFLLLMERAGKTASLNKMANILNISPDTAKRYFEMFCDTYLIYPVMRCGKTTERIVSPKKVYAADLGVRTFFTGFRDKGSLFENYVYLNIRHKNPCYIYEDGGEIDFLTEDKTLIEVKYKGEMQEKQRSLFERVKAREKVVLRCLSDLEGFLDRT